MSTSPFTATLSGQLAVGQSAAEDNCLTLTIRRTDGAPTAASLLRITLVIPVGVGPQALVRDWIAEVPPFTVRTEPQGRWATCRTNRSPASDAVQLVWDREDDPQDEPQADDAEMAIILDKIVSDTAPGKAALQIKAVPSLEFSPLEVLKQQPSDAAQLEFWSDAPDSKDGLLPDTEVTLYWNATGCDSVTLLKDGSTLMSNGALVGSYKIQLGPGTSSYQLSARSTSSLATVQKDRDFKVRQYGWQSATGAPRFAAAAGEPAFAAEPTLLLNRDDAALFAVFRVVQGNQTSARLFCASDPLGAWTEVSSWTGGSPGLPPGMDTSPGVLHQGKIWLIGGSQVNPDVRSNAVWCLDLDAEETMSRGMWTQPKPVAPWAARMGHAVLLHEHRIWVLGGWDDTGNPRNDTWCLDPADPDAAWVELTKPVPWSPRCLHAVAAATRAKPGFWLGGGTTEPFSVVLLGDLHAFSDGWQEAETPPQSIGSWNPLYLGMAEFRMDKCESEPSLIVLAKCRATSGPTQLEGMQLRRRGSAEARWEKLSSPLPLDMLDTDGSARLGMVAYGERMLVVHELVADGKPNTGIWVYVNRDTSSAA